MATDDTLISIRERHQIDVLDLALAVIRRRPGPIAWATLGGVAPFVIGNAWLFPHAGENSPGLGLILWWLEAPLALAPLTLVLGGMMFGRTPSPRQVVAQVFRSAPALVWTHGVLRLVPLYWLPTRLLFANEILLLEQGRWLKLWNRGGKLILGREGDLFFLALVQLLATWLIALVAYMGIGRVVEAVIAEELTWDLPEASVLTGLAFQIPLWIGAAYFTVVRFLTYIDQRIRLEGWEVELRVRTAGQTMAEAHRW